MFISKKKKKKKKKNVEGTKRDDSTFQRNVEISENLWGTKSRRDRPRGVHCAARGWCTNAFMTVCLTSWRGLLGNRRVNVGFRETVVEERASCRSTPQPSFHDNLLSSYSTRPAPEGISATPIRKINSYPTRVISSSHDDSITDQKQVEAGPFVKKDILKLTLLVWISNFLFQI